MVLFIMLYKVVLRWLHWIFKGVNFPPLNVYYVDINKNIRKRLPQLYKDKKVVMIHVLLTSELPWKQNASITFFTFLCISQ